jgi:hypothetical protein
MPQLQIPELVKVEAYFVAKSFLSDKTGGPFLMSGVKYNCYDLLRRALLTVDTQVIDNTLIGLDSMLDENYVEQGIQYPILVSRAWNDRLKTATMYETMFEQKNLWEVLIQIGYYLHAIPYLEFADDGTDRFTLSFKQLGDTRERQDSNTKITVFNSRNLSEYFTQYDAYVTNMFSPQNVIEEWLVCKTSDSTYLVSNDTAEIHTTRPILEILAFDITYQGNTQDALQYIFEASIYEILTSDNPQLITPAKGNAIYYTYGTNKIVGLNYVPPQSSNGNQVLALQEICRRLFGTMDGFFSAALLLNQLMFRVKYRTQDSMRISQMRPDIQNFVSNSSYERYPHHEQFFGQQDKIVDSERFSANLFGKLIRVGNNIFQRQEYVTQTLDEKQAGDLVTIEGQAYYVTEIENEYYHEAILQKVTYSKNFNQLAQIVTIPSEPRFYEVSERSRIRREVRIMEFFEIGTTQPTGTITPKFLPDAKNVSSAPMSTSPRAQWQVWLKQLLFLKTRELPNYVYTRFGADYKRQHKGSYGQVVQPEQLFPSSFIDRTDPNNITPKPPSDHVWCLTPLLHFPIHDGIVFEWDMEDNFKVGDFIDTTQPKEQGSDADSYYPMQSLRYADILGRADLFRFYLDVGSSLDNLDAARNLPYIDDLDPTEGGMAAYASPQRKAPGYNFVSIGLDKDNREELSFNLQLNLLHRASESSDDFITFPNLFGDKDSDLKCCLLNGTVSQFNERVELSPQTVLADNVSYTVDTTTEYCLPIIFGTPNWINGGDISQVQAIVFYQQSQEFGKSTLLAKNVHRLADADKLQPWYIYPVYTN